MATKKAGKHPTRYSFLLNPYSDVRLSKCPRCQRLTHPRKFPLFIDVKGHGPLVLGKTCRYCNRCELIMAHQDELEAELASFLAGRGPKAGDEPYLVIGTFDKKLWREGLQGRERPLADAVDHVTIFKKVFDLHVTGGWGRRSSRGAGGRGVSGEDKARSREAGFDGYLVKPVEPAAFENRWPS